MANGRLAGKEDLMDAISFYVRRSVVSAVVLISLALLAGSRPTAYAQDCGNNVTEAPEECDGPDDSACPGMCAFDCTCAVCGDDHQVLPQENCDGTDDALCPGLCQTVNDPFPCHCAVCGDGFVDQLSEACDGGDDDACPGQCMPDCTCSPICGDNIVNGDESCDGTDDAACPGQCTYNCTCAVCGDNIADGPDESCDGTDDLRCPGLCGAPDGSRPCLCPLTPYKCAYKKGACTSKAVAYLLKCHAYAERSGLGPVDPGCVEHGHTKFDGGADPSTGCFEKLEAAAAGNCFTNDDTGTSETSIDDFVNSVVTIVDPSYPDPVVDFCSAGKKLCVAKLTYAVMKCLGKAETRHLPVDPVCIQKAESTFNGPNPLRSCLGKIATRYTGCMTDDAATLQSASEDFAHDVTCHLDPTGPGCP